MNKTEIYELLIKKDYILKLIDDRRLFEPLQIINDKREITYHWIKENEFDIEISENSFKSNEPFFKIVFKNNHTFMYVALPILENNKKFIIELTKDITNHGSLYIDEYKDGTFQEMVLEIQNEILRDPLSSTYKEYHGLTKLKESINNGKYPISLIYFNLNHMLDLNKQFGEKSGDMMLVQLARLLQNYCVTENDFIVRLNGPRFYLVLHNTFKQRAYSIAKAINRKSQQNTYYFKNEAYRISLNIGYSSMKEKTMDALSFIEDAKNNVLIDNSSISMTSTFMQPKNNEMLKILSNREHEIAKYLLSGLSNSEISDQCFISESTVKKHISSIYAKLNTKSRAEFLSRFNNKAN